MRVDFAFDRADRAGLVRRVYDGFAAAGAPLRAVCAFGGEAPMSVDKVAAWNQARLVGGLRGSPEGDRQVLLDLPPFTDARVYLWFEASTISFCLVVPEEEVGPDEAAVLERVARSMWRSVRPLSIQTLGELGEAEEHEALLRRAPPAAELFAFLGDEYPRSRSETNAVVVSGGRRIAPTPGRSTRAFPPPSRG